MPARKNEPYIGTEFVDFMALIGFLAVAFLVYLALAYTWDSLRGSDVSYVEDPAFGCLLTIDGVTHQIGCSQPRKTITYRAVTGTGELIKPCLPKLQ